MGVEHSMATASTTWWFVDLREQASPAITPKAANTIPCFLVAVQSIIAVMGNSLLQDPSTVAIACKVFHKMCLKDCHGFFYIRSLTLTMASQGSSKRHVQDNLLIYFLAKYADHGFTRLF